MANPDPVWGEYNTVLSYEASSTYAAYLLGPPFAVSPVEQRRVPLISRHLLEYLSTYSSRVCPAGVDCAHLALWTRVGLCLGVLWDQQVQT